jgi:uncharacterized membrane-anchored protein
MNTKKKDVTWPEVFVVLLGTGLVVFPEPATTALGATMILGTLGYHQLRSG